MTLKAFQEVFCEKDKDGKLTSDYKMTFYNVPLDKLGQAATVIEQELVPEGEEDEEDNGEEEVKKTKKKNRRKNRR